MIQLLSVFLAASAVFAEPKSTNAPSNNSPLDAGAVATYSRIRIDPVSPILSMKVNGVVVDVQDFLDTSYARFAMSGKVTVEVTVSSGLKGVAIRPLAFGIIPKISGNTFTFTLNRPTKLRLDINGTRGRLFVFADPHEANPPKITDGTVKSVLDFRGIDNSGNSNCTAGIQAAIDWISQHYQEKSILYFPDGVYKTGTLNVKPKVTVYLNSGAVILASDDYRDFVLDHHDPKNPEQFNVTAFITMPDSHDVKIIGRGMIDGNGKRLHERFGIDHRCVTVLPRNAVNVLMEDVTIRNAWMWHLYFNGGHDIRVRNVKSFTPWYKGCEGGANDGFKLHEGGIHNVTYDDGFIAAFDDAITFGSGAHHCSIKNTIIDLSRASPIRIAFDDGSHDINISNIHVLDNAYYSIFLSDCYPGYKFNPHVPYHDIAFSDWIIEGNHKLINFNFYDAATAPVFHGITFRNITIDDATPKGLIRGGSEKRQVYNVTFQNLKIAGRYRTSAEDANIAVGPFARDIKFQVTSER
jgi:hypothetical protein